MRYKLAFNTYPFAITSVIFLLLASGNLYRALKPLDTRKINTPQDVLHEAGQRGEIVGKAAVQLVVFLLCGYALSQSLARFAPSSPATRLAGWFFLTPIIRRPSVWMVPRNWIEAMRMKKLAFFMVILGMGLFVYGIIGLAIPQHPVDNINRAPHYHIDIYDKDDNTNDASDEPGFWYYHESQVEASAGAMLVAAGLLLLRDSR